ncbi:hypothetical protein Syun_004822 [Stephania yunnanensis]|uniref:VQ domain-containing protein n=1 Tax=Stephania yunnanensis TaxID=152371 RepID=A0AAP0L6B5_9MAGN
MSTTDNNTSQSSPSLNNNNNRDDENREVKQQSDHYLKQLNRASHKISKPIRRPPPPPLEHHHQQQQEEDPQQQQQHQPPVYNINKSDFRDVVQKLTGSPLSSPPPSSSSSSPQIHPSKGPKPPNSRLHRIRPPPLPNLPTNATPRSANPVGVGGPPPPPFSPLPPLPSVHTAAESPITAYMRCLRGSTIAFSPRWGIGNPELNQQQSNQLILPLPSSPFGGIGGVVSPSLVFSPSSQLAPPMSPSWRSL